jgi:hypothetical protein
VNLGAACDRQALSRVALSGRGPNRANSDSDGQEIQPAN